MQDLTEFTALFLRQQLLELKAFAQDENTASDYHLLALIELNLSRSRPCLTLTIVALDLTTLDFLLQAQ